MRIKKKVIIPAIDFDRDNLKVVDKYICLHCDKVVKKEYREVKLGRKKKQYSYLYYGICNICSK